VFPRESGVKDLDVIVWHAAHREYLVEDFDTFHLPRDAIEFCPYLPGDGISLVLGIIFLWVDFLEFHLCRIPQFLV
jgi:hypothetical protein